MQPTREQRGPRHTFPYLVLLRVGFTMPLLLPATRCALTAPFHPYLLIKAGGIFLLHWPSVLTAQALPGTLPYGARTFLHPITEMIEQRLPGQLSLRKIQGNRAKRKEEIG
jgi:hypothetical protein